MHDIIEAPLLFASVRQAAEVKRQPLDMSTVVGEALARLAPDVEATGAEVATPEAWPTVPGYAPWIEQVWTNQI